MCIKEIDKVLILFRNERIVAKLSVDSQVPAWSVTGICMLCIKYMSIKVCIWNVTDLVLCTNCQSQSVHLGVTSKLNRRLTAQNRRFRAVAIVENNSNRPEPPVPGGQPPVEF